MVDYRAHKAVPPARDCRRAHRAVVLAYKWAYRVAVVTDSNQGAGYSMGRALTVEVLFQDRGMGSRAEDMDHRLADMDCKQEDKVSVRGRRSLLQHRTGDSMVDSMGDSMGGTAYSRGRGNTPALDSTCHLFETQDPLASRGEIVYVHFWSHTS